MAPVVSVVSVSWNTASCLPDALDALPAAFGDVSYDVTVVDNGSSDDSVAVLSARPEVTLRALAENTGFTRAANLGASRAEGTYLLFLNPDLVAPPGSLAKLVAALDGAPEAWAASPWFRNPDGSPQHFWRRIPGPIRLPLCYTRWGKRIDRAAGGRWRRWRTYGELPDPPGRMPIEAVGAACLLVRRDLFDAAGGFDERYFNFFQDADLERRMAREGRVLLGVGDVQVEHLMGVTFRRLPGWEVDAQLLHALRQYLLGEHPLRRWAGEAAIRLDLLLPGPHRTERRTRALRPTGVPD